MSTYNKKPYDKIVSLLTEPLDPQTIKTREGKGKKKFRYETHAWYTAMLNKIFGFEAWSFEPLPETKEQMADGSWIIFVRLTIHDHWGWGHDVVAVELGHKEHNERAHMAIGDEIKAAISLGLGRAAMRACGLALELWLGDDVFLSEHTMEEAKKKEDPLVNLAVGLYKESQDPLVEMAKEELGAEVKKSSANVEVNTKIDWAVLYEWAKEQRNFDREKVQAILTKKAGGRGQIVELTKEEITDAILGAK